MLDRWIRKRRWLALALCFTVTLLSLPSAMPTAIAQESAATETEKPSSKPIPRGPKRYKGREIAVTMHYLGAPWLVRESRQREEDCAMLLEALHVKPGQTICDLGCGNGFYTLLLAQRVGPAGKVYAVDIQQRMLDLLDERLGARALHNVTPVLATATDPKLPAGDLDLVLMVDVYHELSHPAEVLASVRASLGPRGRLVLVEFRQEDPLVPIKPLHKMSQVQVLREIRANGFKLVDHRLELYGVRLGSKEKS